MRYKIRLQKSEEGYAVWCPSLPGCWSQGQTEEEALENIKDAIQAYLEVAEEFNRDAEARYVEVINAHTMAGIIKDTGLTIEEFKLLL